MFISRATDTWTVIIVNSGILFINQSEWTRATCSNANKSKSIIMRAIKISCRMQCTTWSHLNTLRTCETTEYFIYRHVIQNLQKEFRGWQD